MPSALSGRRAEAARNDERILESARAVFVADPGAPISAVAEHAGVGVGALYRRYESKEDLLRRPVRGRAPALHRRHRGGAGRPRRPLGGVRGLHARAASTPTRTPSPSGWPAPSPPPRTCTARRAAPRGCWPRCSSARRRPGRSARTSWSTTSGSCSSRSPRCGSATLSARIELRHRYLALLLDACAPRRRDPLPGPPPGWEEIAARWNPVAARRELTAALAARQILLERRRRLPRRGDPPADAAPGPASAGAVHRAGRAARRLHPRRSRGRDRRARPS